MQRDDALTEQVKRPRPSGATCECRLEAEYQMTISVLAVLVERVQRLTGCTEVQIFDTAIADQPDLSAWRDPESVSLAASR